MYRLCKLNTKYGGAIGGNSDTKGREIKSKFWEKISRQNESQDDVMGG
jgi:hypothetical protein